MAFVLAPQSVHHYQAPQCSPFGFCAPASRPSYTYRVARPRLQRPQYSSFNHFFSQVDDLLSEIDRKTQRQAQIEAHREANRQRQLRKRTLRAEFAVNQIENGWQVQGDIRGFDQENINIEVTDENTLKVSGNTQWQAEKKVGSTQVQPEVGSTFITEEQSAVETTNDEMKGITLDEPEFETVTEAEDATIAANSDTESHKSYQPTVEDDYEDLGAETSSLISSPSRPLSPSEVKEPKGKEKAVEETAAVVSTPEQAKHEKDAQQQLQQEERVHGSFERTFRFPERIDATNVSASFMDGVLKIIVPRAQAQQVRRIAIL